MVSETIQTIGQQIDARELRMAGFKLVADDADNSLLVYKNHKTFKIHYDDGSDTYTTTEYRNGEQVGSPNKDVMWEDLKEQISRTFKFEYVMPGIMGRGSPSIEQMEKQKAVRESVIKAVDRGQRDFDNEREAADVWWRGLSVSERTKYLAKHELPKSDEAIANWRLRRYYESRADRGQGGWFGESKRHEEAALKASNRAEARARADNAKEFGRGNKVHGSSSIARDAALPAKYPGKRTSAAGNTYYEYRANRADANKKTRL